MAMLAAIAMWVLALTQVAYANLEATAKALWVLIIIIAPLLGAIAWFFIGKKSAAKNTLF